MSSNLQNTLKDLRKKAKSERQKGEYFEKLMLAFFKNDSIYKSYFKNVWLWKDWPQRKGPDTGVDIVAESNAGDIYAIQCKFYESDVELRKENIDSFLSELGKKPFTKGIIISTTDLWSSNAEKALNRRSKPCQRIGISDLEESDVDWKNLLKKREVSRIKKKLRPHQAEALKKVKEGFENKNAGKLIMPCGTGKTFTSLRIAENLVSSKGNVLFLVPSLSLLSQTLREWTQNTQRNINSFVVCSDSQAGKSEEEDIQTTDLALPPTTDYKKLSMALENTRKNLKNKKDTINVIFSTYHSIKVISDAQKKGSLKNFDLIICDEAHRTTGVEEKTRKKSSYFTKVHDRDFIKAKKRLYMTATPRIYSESSKKKAEENEIKVYSMDDKEKYGKELYRLDFSNAIEKDLLSDYKVSILAISENYVSKVMQKEFSQNSEINTQDVIKIVGCWNGLSKKYISDSEEKEKKAKEDKTPMKRAVAFSGTIKSSKRIEKYFNEIIKAFARNSTKKTEKILNCEVHHVDGTQNALIRNKELRWLKDNVGENECRILTNARCLSEGVDVPALDAVMFLNPRKSEVDIVQSVGRVMRKSEGKNYGHIILPIVVPADIPAEKALDDNKTYQVVWQVLQALRSHDNRFDAMINKIEFNRKRPKAIQIIGVGFDKNDDKNNSKNKKGETKRLELPYYKLEELKGAICAKLVLKCGNRQYLEVLAKDISKKSKILTGTLTRILAGRMKGSLKSKNSKIKVEFNKFLKSLRKNLNDTISENDAIEMLSQHMLTKPIFDALFRNRNFSKENPISKSMESIVKLFENQAKAETKDLKSSYESIKKRVENIDNLEGKQRVIKELYEKVFKEGFPKLSDRLGIVYTPIEIVDFILKSSDEILKKEFGEGLTDKNVHILDPFSGTGTFLARLIQSDLIKKEDLRYKYKEELHSNELVLLAYYITAINIENSYHFKISQNTYESFKGAVLTDTFQMSEEDKGNENNDFLKENLKQIRKQKKYAIRAIVGNPPYSSGQKSENDNNKNLEYKRLDKDIKDTYVESSNSTLCKNLYDSYIRAIRWATDRVGNKGVVSFVTNGSFIDANNMDGLRCHLEKDFTSLYIFNLRGNQRTKGKESRKEGGKIFGQGSRVPVAISFLVKNPAKKDCKIHYYDIGDYLNREEKLKKIKKLKSFSAIDWEPIKPNADHDWINQRDGTYEKFFPMGDKKNPEKGIFTLYSNGVVTARDAWAYNYNKSQLEKNIRNMISFYNKELKRYQEKKPKKLESFLNTDPEKISWTHNVKGDLKKNKKYQYRGESLRQSLYRPFTKSNLYYSKELNERRYLTYKLFPEPDTKNLAICVSGVGSRSLSALMVDTTPNFDLLSKTQCFSRYFYEKNSQGELKKEDNISQKVVKKFQENYKDKKIDGDAIFYYVYGLLHSEDYKKRYASNFGKMLPRIPLVNGFEKYSKIGKELADLHINYEKVKKYPLKIEELKNNNFEVSKMKFLSKTDKSSIIYNNSITLSEIPQEAYEYQVNGRSAIEWIMDRYQAKEDKKSKITNNPNKFSDNPKYIIDLIQRVVSVSIESIKLIKSLPRIKEASYLEEKQFKKLILETPVDISETKEKKE